MLGKFKIKTNLFINEKLNRTFVPDPRDVLFVDPTGLCNLGCKFCAYPKLENGFTMELNFFKEIINQATQMGFSNFFITPMLGDVFMDKTIFEKLEFLENHEKVKSFSFYTNFVLARNIEKIFKFSKLKDFEVSVYGLNEVDFAKVTTKDKKQYALFENNILNLSKLVRENKINCNLHFSIRTIVDKEIYSLSKKDKVDYILGKYNSKVSNEFKFLKSKARISVATLTDTWLGVVEQKDVEDLGLEISRAGPMRGPCNLLFGAIQIRYDGTVHACTRSVGNKLIIGDLKNHNLTYILSTKNPKYKNLISSQLKNRFSEVCKECAHYRSIYQDFESGAGKYGKTLNLKEALLKLS